MMATAAAGVKNTPVVIRNSRIMVGLMAFGAWAGYATTAVLAVMVIVELVSLIHFTWNRLYGLGATLVSAVCSFGAAAQLQQWARTMTQNEAHLDAEGARFAITGDFSSAGTGVFRWDEITAVERRRTSSNLRIYTVRSIDGREATFSPLTFFRAGHLARMIAARAGCPISAG